MRCESWSESAWEVVPTFWACQGLKSMDLWKVPVVKNVGDRYKGVECSGGW